MVILPEDKSVKQLYDAQDVILTRLSPVLAKHPNFWLSGGTVLAREWLHHRISFDLDFFVPHEFSLEDFEKELKGTGFIVDRMFLDDAVYQQLFGKFSISNQEVEVSFIQDKFHHLFKPVPGKNIKGVLLENEMSIYRRKASIIIGLAEKYSNGRSKARDLFDLYVLSQKVMPINDFVTRTWGEAMLENFYEGLANIDTQEILSDNRLYAYPEWKNVDSGEKALDRVMEEVGMVFQDIEEAWKENLDIESKYDDGGDGGGKTTLDSPAYSPDKAPK